MTVTDKIKIIDSKIKANQAQYNLGREAAKISALSSKDLLEKYEYLTGEDLGHRPSVLEKTKSEYSPLGMSLSKSFQKNEVKNIAKSENDFSYDSNHKFYEFYKRYDEFEEMSLGSKYKKINDFNKKLIKLKIVASKKLETQKKKEQNMENVDKLYEKYYDAYKDDYDTNDELNEAKKKEFNYTKFKLEDKKNEKSKLAAFPRWLSSRNDFNEAIKFIEDIKVDPNNVKSSSGKEKVFHDLHELINDIKNEKL